MFTLKVSDVGNQHPAFRGMKVVVFDVAGDVYVRARSHRLTDEGAASPAQNRHPADEFVGLPVVPHHLQPQCLFQFQQEDLGGNRFGKVADTAQTHLAVGVLQRVDVERRFFVRV